mgnify:CR=1 FL=1
MLAATSSISTAAEDTETVIGGASVRYMGAEATIACCTAADACCLCAPQDRLRALLRVSPSSWALSACILRAAHGYVRLAACGVRGEERGRDARATGWRAEVRDISAFRRSRAYLGTPAWWRPNGCRAGRACRARLAAASSRARCSPARCSVNTEPSSGACDSNINHTRAGKGSGEDPDGYYHQSPRLQRYGSLRTLPTEVAHVSHRAR